MSRWLASLSRIRLPDVAQRWIGHEYDGPDAIVHGHHKAVRSESFVGRQIPCGEIGVLDILARDRTTDSFVVIELKRDQGDDETFGQLSRYMGWIAENKDQPDGVPVAGIIVAAEIMPKLEAAAKTNPNVRLVEYAIRLELSSKGSVKTGDGD